MAWAEKLPSGRYRGVYRDAAGKRQTLGATYTHKRACERAAAAAEQEARESLTWDRAAQRRPWGEWCDTWWPTRAVVASTLRNDTSRLRNHLRPRWDEVPVGAITRQDVRAWAADLSRAGLGEESVKKCVHLLSASLAAAIDAGIITSNPAARLRLRGGQTAEERYLTYAEYDRLLEEVDHDDDALVIELLAHTGLRWSELAGLHAARVDLRSGVLRVVETYDETAGTMSAYPKGRRLRSVPLTPELVAKLRARKRATIGGDCGVPHVEGRRCPGPLMIETQTGRPLRNSNWAYRVFKPAVERADVGHVRIHDLRHTYASWLLQNGVPLAEVGQLLGHLNPQTTQRYAHLQADASPRVLAALKRPAAEPTGAPRLPHEGAS